MTGAWFDEPASFMKQTPIHDNFNPDLLALIPRDARHVVEVGCSGGALAREYRKLNTRCEYTGVEIDPDYAAIARSWCTRVVSGNIEGIDEAVLLTLFPSDCWVFGDVLEHLYDPWEVLQWLRKSLSSGASIVACIPNAQHWSMQARINSGRLRYEDSGLLDRTHIRWFTKLTIDEMFGSCGFRIVDFRGRVFPEPQRDRALAGVRALAQAIGVNPDEAASDAIPLQWVLRAVPI
jgi:SAM-dependent methyltransferase